MARYDVFGICNPLYDIQAEVSDALLETLGFEKGSMNLVDQDRQRAAMPLIYSHIVNSESGGSGANTMIGLAQLGRRVTFTGRVGDDDHARLYREGLVQKGVKANLGVSVGGMTGICLVLITPDAQRTMLTCLGCCQDLNPHDLNLEDLRASRFLYVTGYQWDTDSQKETVLKAMEEAKAAGVKVSMSMSDLFCVQRHHDDFLRIVQDYVDVCFANWREAQSLTGIEDPEESLAQIAEWCDIGVVTMDQYGALIRRGEEIHNVPVFPEPRVDTTGAGDIFAAGVLDGLCRGLGLRESVRIATYIAGRCVATLGPRLESISMDVVARVEAGGSP